MEITTLYRRSVERWSELVQAVPPEEWSAPTPCAGWTVRDLVNHVVGEDRWTVPLMQGRTIAQVGTELEGDLLGPDPGPAATAAARDAIAAADRTPPGGKVHLSYGDEDPQEYLWQLTADHLVHGWDLAAATGAERQLDPDLVAAVGQWFAEREEMYRSYGLVAARGALTGEPQADLLAKFGRSPSWGANDALLTRFADAFARGDVDTIMSLMTDDCVFESTSPAPDGARHEGAASVRAVWTDLFGATTDPSFETEEQAVLGDRGMLRWRFGWTEPDGAPGSVRGVDVLTFRDGKVSEKLSYVKG